MFDPRAYDYMTEAGFCEVMRICRVHSLKTERLQNRLHELAGLISCRPAALALDVLEKSNAPDTIRQIVKLQDSLDEYRTDDPLRVLEGLCRREAYKAAVGEQIQKDLREIAATFTVLPPSLQGVDMYAYLIAQVQAAPEYAQMTNWAYRYHICDLRVLICKILAGD